MFSFQQHHEQCPNYPVPCPNKDCAIVVKRCEVKILMFKLICNTLRYFKPITKIKFYEKKEFPSRSTYIEKQNVNLKR